MNPSLPDPRAATTPSLTTRIRSLDLLRGVIMILMAIDHVRVYSGLPAGGPTAGIFFTRWITHFVAPGFAFLAGTGAFLHGKKLGDTKALARYLLNRGFILILLEMTVIRVSWTFNFDYAHYILAGVIWMLGICMILMAALVRFKTKTIAIFGLSVIFLQQLVAVPTLAMSEGVKASVRWIWQFLYFGGGIQLSPGGPEIAVLYSIVPWIGVMAAGYAFGALVQKDPAARRRLCLRIGLSATALFLVVGSLVAVLRPDEEMPNVLFRLLNQNKYPASQLFLLMTLGPMIALLPLAERARGWFADVVTTFGRVPLFYYLLHIPLIHAAAIVVSLIRTSAITPWLFGNHPLRPPEQPAGYMWSLPLLYLVFAAVIVILYVPCRWYAGLRARRPTSWLRYI
jgi:uncharacterized membrane protein